MESTYPKTLPTAGRRSLGRRLVQFIADRAHMLANSPWSYGLFAGLGLLEGTLVTISMDAVLLLLGIANPRRAIYFSLFCIVGSTVGGLIGYQLGTLIFASYLMPLINRLGWDGYVQQVLSAYRANAILTLVTSGYLPLPYSLLTWLAGIGHTVPIVTFTWASLLGRTLRFLPTGLLLFYVGPHIVPYIEKYIGHLLIICTLVVAGLLLLQYYH